MGNKTIPSNKRIQQTNNREHFCVATKKIIQSSSQIRPEIFESSLSKSYTFYINFLYIPDTHFYTIKENTHKSTNEWFEC